MKSVAQPVVQENCNWTGFYIGALVGYQRSDDLSWRDTDTSIAPESGADTGGVSNVTHTSQSGVLTGGELGFNYQIGRFVFGAEGDFASSEAKGTRIKFGSPNTEYFDTRNDLLGSAGLRIGYSYRQFLFYVKGGAAFNHLRYSWKHGVAFTQEDDENAHVDAFEGDEWRVSPFVAGGVEYAINCHWSAKMEYSHTFNGGENFDGTNTEADTGPEPESFHSDMADVDSVRVGLNYRFRSWGGNSSPSINVATTVASSRLEGKDYKSTPVQMPVEQECRWTGLYIGGHFGYGWGDATWRDADTAGDGAEAVSGATDLLVDQHQGGFIGGGQLGYNYQIGRFFVIGAEGDFSYSDMRAHTVKDLTEEPNAFDTKNDWVGSIAGRAGVTFHHVLFYAKGGAAFLNERYQWEHGDFFGPDEISVDKFRSSDTYTAGMVGGGIEYALNCHWSIKAEYNHVFLDAQNITGTRIDDGIPEPETFRVDINHDSVKFGLNYKF